MMVSLPMSITPGRCIVFIVCLSLTLVLSMSSPKSEVEPLNYHDVQFVPRQIVPSPGSQTSPTSTTTPTPTATSQTTGTSTTPTPEKTPTATSTSPTATSTSPKSDSTSPTVPPQSSTTPTSGQGGTFLSLSTGADGSTITVTEGAPSSSSTPTPTAPPKDDAGSSSGGLGTGSIIGLSVAGGIALLGIAAFFIWKFTRKHRSAGYDDGEIKWPDLNSENHNEGVDDHTGHQSLSEHASMRGQSLHGYSDGGLGASHSQVDLYVADPYAVPPLPHLNPNQPYRDDPVAGTYQDNFNPPPLHESRPSSPSIRGEAIPMNQINRSRSPGPQVALYAGHGGRQSPAPQGVGIGRQSPGPQDAYGGGYGRRSPGPNDAYGPR